MAIDAQRIHGRAAKIREERAARKSDTPTTRAYDAERDGDESVDTEADLGATPVSDEGDRIARTEALSAFRSSDEQRGLGDPMRTNGLRGYEEQVSKLGSDLAEQVDARVQDWLADARDEFGNVTQTKPQSFMVGALFGGLILALGVLLGGRTRFR